MLSIAQVNWPKSVKVVGKEKTTTKAPPEVVTTEKATTNADEGGKKPNVEKIDIPSCPCPESNCTCEKPLDTVDSRNIIGTCRDSTRYCYEPLEVGPCPKGHRLEATEVLEEDEEKNTTQTVVKLKCKVPACPDGKLVPWSNGTCVNKTAANLCPSGWYPAENAFGVADCECEYFRVYTVLAQR